MQAVWRAESQADNSTMVSKELVLSFQSVVNKWVRSVPRLRPLRRFLTSNRYLPASTLMMTPDVAPASMSCGGVGRLGDWHQRRVPQICRRDPGMPSVQGEARLSLPYAAISRIYSGLER